MPEGLSHYDPEAELAADEAAARERAKQEHLRIVPDANEATGNGLPDPAKATGAESLGGGYSSQRSNLTLIDTDKDWNLDPKTIEIGLRGVDAAKRVLAGSDDPVEKAKQRAVERNPQSAPPLAPPPIPPRVERFEQHEDQAS